MSDRRPVRRVQRLEGATYDARSWPYRLAPVAQLLEDGLDLPAGVTFLVGENGSGKSTLVEAVAAAAGLNLEGGSRHARHATRASESPLHEALQLVRSPGAPLLVLLPARRDHARPVHLPRGAPTEPAAATAAARAEPRRVLLAVLSQHFDEPGLYVMDEPEAALSFSSCLALVAVLDRLARVGGQVLCATHSPLLTALPGATVLQLTDAGYAPVEWQDLDLVRHWRHYLADPRSSLRHVLD